MKLCPLVVLSQTFKLIKDSQAKARNAPVAVENSSFNFILYDWLLWGEFENIPLSLIPCSNLDAGSTFCSKEQQPVHFLHASTSSHAPLYNPKR